MSNVTVYIPIYNGAEWCRQLELADSVSYIASDNGSTDGTPEILESRGVHVIRQPKSLGRLGNWRFCLEHFQQSEGVWMKFLFAGDKLALDCAAKVEAASLAFPQVDVLLFGWNIIEDGKEILCRPSDTPREFAKIEALVKAVKVPNWFGFPMGTVIHRRALRESISFGTLDWAGDFYLITNMARHCTMAAFPDIIATFVATHRKHYNKLRSSLQAFLEEIYVQELAIRKLEELGCQDCALLRRELTQYIILHSVSLMRGQPEEAIIQCQMANHLTSRNLGGVLFARVRKKLGL